MRNILATVVLGILAGFCVALLCATLQMDGPWGRIARPFVALGIVILAGVVLQLILSRVLGELPGAFDKYDFPNMATLWGAWLMARTALVIWLMVLGNCDWLPQALLDGRPFLMQDGGWVPAIIVNVILFFVELAFVIPSLASGEASSGSWGSGGSSSRSTPGSSLGTPFPQSTPSTSYDSPPAPTAPTWTYQAPPATPRLTDHQIKQDSDYRAAQAQNDWNRRQGS